jgi:16S rRNA (cytosine1402-N4)-methyltransferase
MYSRKALKASPEEVEVNPRSRSAKLRIGRRTDAPAMPVDAKSLGAPQLPYRRPE